MFDREVKDFSVYSWLFVTAGFYPVSTDDLLEANVRFCRKADIQIYALGKFGSLKSKRASGGGLSLLRHRDRYADGFVPGSQV